MHNAGLRCSKNTSDQDNFAIFVQLKKQINNYDKLDFCPRNTFCTRDPFHKSRKQASQKSKNQKFQNQLLPKEKIK